MQNHKPRAGVERKRRELVCSPLVESIQASSKLTQVILDKAVRIYFKHAYDRSPEKYDFMNLSEISRQLDDEGWTEWRLCCGKTGSNMKLTITLVDGRACFSVYNNDYGFPDSAKKLNEKINKSIVNEWKRSGIPVLPDRIC